MLKKIAYTFLSKMWALVLTFLLILLTTHYLGKEGRGAISNWTAAINLLTQIGLCFGGPALVYFASRYNNQHLLKNIFRYNIVVSILSVGIIYIFYQQLDLGIYIPIIAFINVVFISFSMLLTGHNRIGKVNVLNNICITLQVAIFAFICYTMQPTAIIYLLCFAAALFATSIIGYLFLNNERTTTLPNMVTQNSFVSKGVYSQMSNIFQLMNYRLSYFLIPFFLNESYLGIYSVAIALGEAIWLAGKSIALINLGNVASGQIDKSSIKRSILLSFTITGICCLILYIIPNETYIYVFGKQFFEVKQQLIYLFPGIVLCSLQFVPAAYFAGKGDFKYNNIAAICGFVLTALLNYIYIPQLGLQGAALAFDVALAVSSIILLVSFYRKINIAYQK